MPDPILTWAAHNWGWLVALVIFLVVNGDKVVVRLSQVAPPLARWLEAREAARQKQQNGQAAAVLQHVLTSDVRDQLTQTQLLDRMITILESTLDRAFASGEVTNKALADVHKQLAELRSVVARHNDILGTHGQNVAHLADEMEGVKVQVAGVTGKLDSLGAWSFEMQSLRREVSG
jgi:hypothetical protein